MDLPKGTAIIYMVLVIMYGCVSAEITVSNVASISPDSTTNPGPSVGVTDSPSPASKPGTSVGVLGSQTPASKPGTSVGVTGSPTPASKTGPTVGVTGNPSPASKPGTSVGVLGSQTPASKPGTSVGVTGSPTPASKTGPTVGATGSPSHSPNLGPSVGATSHLISDKTQPPSVSVMGSSTPTGKPVPNIATTKIPTSVKNQTTQTSSAVNTNFFENIQKFLLNSQATKLIQNQIGDFIKTNNVSFPISVMTPENLQKVLQLLGSGSNNLQGISQYAGLLGNFSNDLRNVTEELEQHISPQCFSHLEFLVSELLKREQWAFKMIDASGKIPAGILDGNMVWMGSYDECLKVDTEKFQGQHCTTTLSVASILGSMFDIPAALDVHLGVCMPDSCNVSETNAVLNTLLGLLPLGENKLSASNVACSERPEYDDLAIGGFTVCGVFFLLMVLSTLFDVMYSRHQKKFNMTVPYENGVTSESKYRVNGDVENSSKPRQPGICARLAMTFSVYTNGRKLMSTEQAGGALGAINGIRFLSISWVVLGHSFSSGLNNLQNPTFMADFISNWTSMVLVNGLLSVDSFFTLSGLLVSYLFMREMKREKGRINWFMFYFHRFWRLTPAYMLVLFLDMSLLRYLGDGPFWSKEGLEPNCRETWWTNLLYINNVYKKRKMCFGWSWYLANDMQFYVVSPLLLVPLYFWKKIGLFVSFLALLGIWIVTGIISGHYELLPTLFSTDTARMMAQQDKYFYEYYIVPWCRMGPYIVGIVTGYIIYKTDGKFKIPKGINMLVWTAIALTALLVVYGINGPVEGDDWGNGVNALYNAVHRSVWGMCVCWVIFACVTGNGGIVNDFLSWKLFVPLGKLSYCIYLTHLLVLEYYLLSMRQSMYATTLELTFLFLGTLMLSILVSIVASLAFEAPMMALEKVVFRRGKK